MKSYKDPRHIARVIAVMDLYKNFFPLEEIKEDQIAFDFDGLELGNYTKALAKTLYDGVIEKHSEIDALIDEVSTPVKTIDLDNVILQIVRVSVFEGFILKSVPPKVSVDEAIEITRDFGLEVSARKVGGMLGKVFETQIKKPEVDQEKVKAENDSKGEGSEEESKAEEKEVAEKSSEDLNAALNSVEKAQLKEEEGK